MDINSLVPSGIGGGQVIVQQQQVAKCGPADVAKYIANLESYEVRIKELHWSAEDDKTHILCDEVRDKVCGLQDELAEIYMGIAGEKFGIGFLANAKECTSASLPEFCKDLINDTCCIIEGIQDIILLRGIKGELEEFVGYLQQILYKETQK